MSGTTEHTGYNKLDADFKAKETVQLAKIRAELDATRAAAQAQASKDAHWRRDMRQAQSNPFANENTARSTPYLDSVVTKSKQALIIL